MSSIPTGPALSEAAGVRLGVIDALGMGWRLMMSDFWPIWLVGFVLLAIHMGLSFAGNLPFVGIVIQLAVGFLVQPPLWVGLYYAVSRRIDGRAAKVDYLFEGFRQRYWQSVVVALQCGVIMIAAMVPVVIPVGILAASGALDGSAREEVLYVVIPIVAVLGVAWLALFVAVTVHLIFSYLAVWDHPVRGGWEAVKDSARVVRRHFWPTVGVLALFGLIAMGAILAGLLACGIGVLFTLPVVLIWQTAAYIYLYRSWTGRALVEPAAAAGAAGMAAGAAGTPGGAAGPIQPSGIEPPEAR